MEFTHEKFGQCVLGEITQKKLEDFTTAMKGKEGLVMTVWHGETVRAALKFGILTEPNWKPEDVDNANPGHIRWLSECMAKMIAKATSIDPLPESPSPTTQAEKTEQSPQS